MTKKNEFEMNNKTHKNVSIFFSVVDLTPLSTTTGFPLAYMLINSICVRNAEASWKPRGQDYKF